jgi:hypothetical protein
MKEEKSVLKEAKEAYLKGISFAKENKDFKEVRNYLSEREMLYGLCDFFIKCNKLYKFKLSIDDIMKGCENYYRRGFAFYAKIPLDCNTFEEIIEMLQSSVELIELIEKKLNNNQ